MAQLVLLLEGQPQIFTLDQSEIIIGRHPDCQFQINSNMVSRRHARLTQQQGQFILEDLGSGNGTFVNGKKIEAPVVLHHEDRIKLGPVLLRFENPSAAKPKPSKPWEQVPATRAADPQATLAAQNFDDKFAISDDDAVSLSGQSVRAGGFGRLEVRPEAKLKAVLEISRNLAGTTELDALLPRILDTLFHVFPHADRGAILFKDESGKMIPRAVKYRRTGDDETFRISRTILRTVLEQKTGILSADATTDARFQASESIANLTIRSMMCVPMLGLDGEPMGVISIDTQNPFNQFQEEDLDLLVAVAGQAALSYESARLLTTALEKQKQDREMQIAMGVQRALLPEKLPQPPQWEFYASYDTAQAVGGDYFDCMLLPDQKRVCFAFGDVAGKGVPASLVMSRISSVVTNVMAFVDDVQEAVCRINNQMCAKAVEGRFVTFVLGIVDPESGLMQVANAGHMPLLIRRRDGSLEEFGEEIIGVPLGVMEDFPFEATQRNVAPGEMVVLYTDGVSEAMNPQGELYGIDRLKALVQASPAGKAEELGKAILADVRKHANGRAQNDDITIMVFGRHSE